MNKKQVIKSDNLNFNCSKSNKCFTRTSETDESASGRYVYADSQDDIDKVKKGETKNDGSKYTRTAPVFNSMQDRTDFAIKSDKIYKFTVKETGVTNFVKYELGDDLIIKYEQNNHSSTPISNMTIYKGKFNYKIGVLRSSRIEEMVSASNSKEYGEDYRYWEFEKPKSFQIERALSFAGFADFPLPTTTHKQTVINEAEQYLEGNWWKNLFEHNFID